MRHSGLGVGGLGCAASEECAEEVWGGVGMLGPRGPLKQSFGRSPLSFLFKADQRMPKGQADMLLLAVWLSSFKFCSAPEVATWGPECE